MLLLSLSAGRQISLVHFSLVQRQTMLSVYSPSAKPSSVRLDSKTNVCIWNIWEPNPSMEDHCPWVSEVPLNNCISEPSFRWVCKMMVDFPQFTGFPEILVIKFPWWRRSKQEICNQDFLKIWEYWEGNWNFATQLQKVWSFDLKCYVYSLTETTHAFHIISTCK